MSAETVEALKKAADNGIIIVPTTGRNLSGVPETLEAFKEIEELNAALEKSLEVSDKKAFLIA